MSKKDWNKRLLSSSLPLEYQVGKLLESKKFRIEFDYTYQRPNEINIDKDFSIDIKAVGYSPFYNPNSIKLDVELLIECKYKTEDKVWAFLPEVNVDLPEKQMMHGFRLIESFSTLFLDKFPALIHEHSFESTLKATEINKFSGDVYDKEIVRGINQLKYALPNAIHQNILFNLNHIDDSCAFMIIPLLVTTAELRIFNSDLNIQTVKEAKNLDEISTEVNNLVLINKPTGEFRKYHKMIFNGFENELKEIEVFNKIQKIRSSNFEEAPLYSEHPLNLAKDFEDSYGYLLDRYYSHYYVCNINYLDEFIENIKKCSNKMVKGRKKMKFKKKNSDT